MPLNFIDSLLLILVVALVTFSTRVIPFILFPKGKKIPPTIIYLGGVLTPAIIAMLVVYCMKHISFFHFPFGLPEFIASAVVVALHLWKRNIFLSIASGTILYMLLVQFVFI